MSIINYLNPKKSSRHSSFRKKNTPPLNIVETFGAEFVSPYVGPSLYSFYSMKTYFDSS